MDDINAKPLKELLYGSPWDDAKDRWMFDLLWPSIKDKLTENERIIAVLLMAKNHAAILETKAFMDFASIHKHVSI